MVLLTRKAKSPSRRYNTSAEDLNVPASAGIGTKRCSRGARKLAWIDSSRGFESAVWCVGSERERQRESERKKERKKDRETERGRGRGKEREREGRKNICIHSCSSSFLLPRNRLEEIGVGFIILATFTHPRQERALPASPQTRWPTTRSMKRSEHRFRGCSLPQTLLCIFLTLMFTAPELKDYDNGEGWRQDQRPTCSLIQICDPHQYKRPILSAKLHISWRSPPKRSTSGIG